MGLHHHAVGGIETGTGHHTIHTVPHALVKPAGEGDVEAQHESPEAREARADPLSADTTAAVSGGGRRGRREGVIGTAARTTTEPPLQGIIVDSSAVNSDCGSAHTTPSTTRPTSVYSAPPDLTAVSTPKGPPGGREARTP
jgi:hypothetical protein